MLQALRRFSKSWISAIFLGLIALSFAVWGIGDIFQGSTDTTAVAVGPRNISVTEFQREYQNIVRNQGRAMGVDLTPEQARKAKFPERTLELMINRVAMDNLANDLKLTANDEQVAEGIRAIPAFNGPAGTFDHDTFLRAISQAGFGEAEFVEVMRSDMKRGQLEQAMSAGFVLPPRLLNAWYAHAMQTRAAEYFVLPASAAGTIAPPTDAQLAAYVKENAARFSTAEYRDISYASLSPSDLAAQMPVSDDDIKQEFEARRTTYITPEKRDLDQIRFGSEAEAKAGRAKIESGMSFSALATERGLKPSDTPIGTFARSDLDAARGDVAFALAEGGVSQPVKGPFGWVLLHVSKVAAGSTKTLEDVRADIRTALATQAAINKLIDTVNKFVDERAGGATIEEAAKKSGMKYGRVSAVDSNGMLPSGEKAPLPLDPEFLTQAFATDVGEDLDPVQAKSGNYFALRVEGVTPPKVKAMADIRATATASWIAEQRSSRLNTKAIALAAQATQQKSLAAAAQSVGATIQKSGSLTRTSMDKAIPAETLSELFLAKPGAAVSGPGAEAGSIMVARVTGVSHPKLPMGSPDILRAVQQMSGMIANDITELAALAMRKKYGVRVNQALVAQATGEGP